MLAFGVNVGAVDEEARHVARRFKALAHERERARELAILAIEGDVALAVAVEYRNGAVVGERDVLRVRAIHRNRRLDLAVRAITHEATIDLIEHPEPAALVDDEAHRAARARLVRALPAQGSRRTTPG